MRKLAQGLEVTAKNTGALAGLACSLVDLKAHSETVTFHLTPKPALSTPGGL